jgi:hypothetical protein
MPNSMSTGEFASVESPPLGGGDSNSNTDATRRDATRLDSTRLDATLEFLPHLISIL